MRLTILGGGGFRVPLVHSAVLADGLITELCLHDTDAGRLATIDQVLQGQADRASRRVSRVVTTDLDEALDGADMVFSAIRVGGLAGRVADEQVAIAHGVLGQETTGAGGIAYGIRTVPVALRIAETVRRRAPGAWVVNFTNPAGMITQAMQQVLPGRVIGICDSPIGLAARASRALGLALDDLDIDYAGLNHLGWLQALRQDGADLLPGLLDSPARLDFEEGHVFGPQWLAALGAIPNEYLYYYYFAREARAATAAAGLPRGSFLREQQERFYAAARQSPAHALPLWEAARHERDASYMAEARSQERAEQDVAGGGYERVALALMSALTGGPAARLILNVPNAAALPGLPEQCVVEVPCAASTGQVTPLPVSPLSGHRLGLAQQVAAAYASAIEAALTGSPTIAARAFAEHPLVDSVNVGRALTAAYRGAIPEYAAVIGG